eukprot:g9029.t1
MDMHLCGARKGRPEEGGHEFRSLVEVLRLLVVLALGAAPHNCVELSPEAFYLTVMNSGRVTFHTPGSREHKRIQGAAEGGAAEAEEEDEEEDEEDEEEAWEAEDAGGEEGNRAARADAAGDAAQPLIVVRV